MSDESPSSNTPATPEGAPQSSPTPDSGGDPKVEVKPQVIERTEQPGSQDVRKVVQPQSIMGGEDLSDNKITRLTQLDRSSRDE